MSLSPAIPVPSASAWAGAIMMPQRRRGSLYRSMDDMVEAGAK
jgi:hypothetical protein